MKKPVSLLYLANLLVMSKMKLDLIIIKHFYFLLNFKLNFFYFIITCSMNYIKRFSLNKLQKYSSIQFCTDIKMMQKKENCKYFYSISQIVSCIITICFHIFKV